MIIAYSKGYLVAGKNHTNKIKISCLKNGRTPKKIKPKPVGLSKQKEEKEKEKKNGSVKLFLLDSPAKLRNITTFLLLFMRTNLSIKWTRRKSSIPLFLRSVIQSLLPAFIFLHAISDVSITDSRMFNAISVVSIMDSRMFPSACSGHLYQRVLGDSFNETMLCLPKLSYSSQVTLLCVKNISLMMMTL